MLKALICYPNTPYIAFSSLGWQYIYRELTKRQKIHCESLFLSNNNELIAYTSKKNLYNFDIIAFSLQYELDYINFFKILEILNVPFYSKNRKGYPLIIAGGPAISANPEPLSEFIDIFFIGEAEENINKFIDIFIENKYLDKIEILKEIKDKINDLYIPSLNNTYSISKVNNYYDYGFSSIFLEDKTEFSNTLLIELSRGCTKMCKFCLGSSLFRPFRATPLEYIIDLLNKEKNKTSKLGLISASVCDYPKIDNLSEYLLSQNYTVSTSSLQIDRLKISLLELLAKSNNNLITLAIESGSEKLRKYIGKNITDNQILEAIKLLTKYNFKKLKLYFIIGLPNEQEEDIIKIIDLMKNIKEITKNSSFKQIILNINPFIPKKLTPFANNSFFDYKKLLSRQRFLQKELNKLGIITKFESIKWAYIQYLLAQGDKKLGEILIKILQNTYSWNMLIKNMLHN